jgi:ABC-type nitrate/sulfonate/bicarbonate transport system substrate-binding protein
MKIQQFITKAVLLFAWPALCNAQESAQKYSLKVGYLPATHDALLFIAVHEKLFPSNLSVELVKFTSSPDILNEMTGGRVDIAIPGIAAPIQRIAEGAPFNIIGGAAQESAAVVVRLEHKPKFFAGDQLLPKADRIHAFEKMKVGSVKLSTGDALFRCAIKDNNVHVALNDSYHNPKDVLADLKGGRLDAAVLWSPHMTTAEEESGLPIVLWLGEVLRNHVCCRQVVRHEYLKDNREAVVLYLVGLIKAKLVYDSAQKLPPDKERVLSSVAQYVLNPRNVLEKELFGGSPRTKVSVDLNPRGITEYLQKMAQENLVSTSQAARVNQSVDPTVITDAYKRFHLSDAQAELATTQGFESIAEVLRTQPQN